jgi:Flp pilus assembly protein TadD
MFPKFQPKTARDYFKSVLQHVHDQLVVSNGIMTAEACLMQARVWSQLGGKEEAEHWARRALEQDATRSDIQLFLADLLVRQDRMEEAAESLRQALRLKPDLPGAQRQLGAVLDRLGNREGARKAFESAIQLAPRDATARFLLGRLQLDQGQAREAAANLQAACQIDPALSGVFYALSEAQDQLGESAAAADSLKTFQRLKQEEKEKLDAQNVAYNDEKYMRALAAGFHLEAAGLLIAQKQPALAEAHLRQALQISPDEPRGYEILATVLRQTGRLAEARTCYETLVRLKPGQAACHLNLGTLLLELKDYPAAVLALKAALEIDPRQPQALANLSRFYLSARQEAPEALALSRRLVEVRPAAASYDLLGWACYVNGLTNEAREAARQAVEREPANPAYRTRYQKLQGSP